MSRLPATEILTECLHEHEAVKAWRQIRPDHLELDSVEIMKRKNKSAVYRLRSTRSDGPAIIAKRCRAATAEVERLIYEQILPRMPIPALHCYGLVKEPEGEFCWLFLEEAVGGSYSPQLSEHRALAACWLAKMHLNTVPALLQACLPDRTLSHYQQLLRSGRATLLDHLAHNTALSGDDASVFRKVARHCDVIESHWNQMENICGVMPLTLVHGDFVIKNVRIQDGIAPSLVVFDWEFAGWGVPAADLAQFAGFVAAPDLSVYCSVLQRNYPHLDLRDVERAAACGNLFRLLNTITWAISMLQFGPPIFLPKPVATLRVYELRLVQALSALRWELT